MKFITIRDIELFKLKTVSQYENNQIKYFHITVYYFKNMIE